MPRKWRWFSWKAGAALLLVVALGVWYIYSTRKSAAPEVRPEVGYLAPDFALSDLEGRIIRLSDLRGKKAVFLNFWATWCPPCRAEMPTMQKAYEQHQSRGLEILAVSIDRGGKKAVQEFMQELKLTFPALLDPDMSVLRMYRVVGIPVSLLIDRKGIIRYKHVGSRDWTSAESKKQLAAILK
ncbi:MAG: TlpA family protein disulfide reductase [Candidatus Tectomicrobia bacterium]|uniref:TlpA family protein disulfide reductase n=1 Tax=Tectimicrobiota bacterium TaxID=2528274 RepID=A0A932GQE2_UNCTE|nr:TlpA family protein disulfide reductase [Candidatus Tectomicrobia bacterium]